MWTIILIIYVAVFLRNLHIMWKELGTVEKRMRRSAFRQIHGAKWDYLCIIIATTYVTVFWPIHLAQFLLLKWKRKS